MKEIAIICVMVLCLHLLSMSKGVDGSSGENGVNTKITDLNFDCLEKVFQFLPKEDLINVARANSHLTEAANYIFSRHGENVIHISDSNQWAEPKPEPMENDLRIPTVKPQRFYLNSLEFRSILHIISDSVRAIAMDFNNIEDSVGLLSDIMKHCIEQIETIEFYGVSETRPMLNKPFPNVKSVAIMDGVLSENLLQFNQWFPAMKSLKLSNIIITASELIITNYPNLVNFATTIDSNRGFSVQNYKRFLQANQQIRNINVITTNLIDVMKSVYQDREPNLMEFINNTLPQLETLAWGPSLHKMIGRTNGLVKFQNVKKLNAYFNWIFQMIPYQFEQLESLSIAADEWSESFVSFIGNHSDITKLELKNVWTSNFYLNITEIIAPKLSVLLIDGIEVELDILLDVLKNYNSLTKFQWIVYYGGVRLGEFECPDEWKYSVENSKYSSTYTFERQSTRNQSRYK